MQRDRARISILFNGLGEVGKSKKNWREYLLVVLNQRRSFSTEGNQDQLEIESIAFNSGRDLQSRGQTAHALFSSPS
jgi:hypothetical protein